MSELKNRFEVLQVTKLSDLGKGTSIPESDLTIQTGEEIIQYKFVEEEERVENVEIKPGCFSFENTQCGLKLQPFQLRDYDLLKSIDNTAIILKEANTFFDRLYVYEQLNRDKKRAVLLCSQPGCGKSASLNEVCKKFLIDPGTCVVIWDTSSVKSQSVSSLFLSHAKFLPTVTRLILVIEDIGGGSTDGDYGPRGAESALLNLLDGVGSPFKGVPTFILATTNNPETSVEALIDRPGRFDKVIELKHPNTKECEELLVFIQKISEATEEDKQSAKLAAENHFSIAHLQEVIVRSKLDDIGILESTNQLVKHKKRFQNAFKKETKSIGFGK
ncbi:MAG TPA: AAA family ATPase [Patescibacteria group bacterium]|nr:AAA family ATPase [Patescibacteria group bacterium]